jgi:hypothetical protein
VVVLFSKASGEESSVNPENLGRPGLVVPVTHEDVLNILPLDLGESAAEVFFAESGERISSGRSGTSMGFRLS